MEIPSNHLPDIKNSPKNYYQKMHKKSVGISAFIIHLLERVS